MNINSFTQDNPVIVARISAGITTFCLQNDIPMAKNGCDHATAWNIAKECKTFLYTSSDTLELGNDLFLKLELFEPGSKMARFAIMWQGEADMFGYKTMVVSKVGTIGHEFTGWAETPEYLSAVMDVVMNGNENTPLWLDVLRNRDMVHNYAENNK